MRDGRRGDVELVSWLGIGEGASLSPAAVPAQNCFGPFPPGKGRVTIIIMIARSVSAVGVNLPLWK